MTRAVANEATWFWSRVGPADPIMGCREWLQSRNAQGYGRCYRKPGNRKARAHRVAWELVNGPIPDGLWVLHRCDNPPCCEPTHLFLGDAQDNVNDMLDKGRWQAATGLDHWTRKRPEKVKRGTASAKYGSGLLRTHCNAGHSLTGDNARYSPARGRYGPRLECRTCKRLAYLNRKG